MSLLDGDQRAADAPTPPVPSVACVHLRLGPLPAKNVRLWIGYAREVLDAVPSDAGGDGLWLPADAVSGFQRYLDAWAETADADKTFSWEGDIPSEEAEYLFHAFFRVATHLSSRAEATGPRAPAGSEQFYRTLVSGLLTALDREGEATSEFSAHLRAFWPGIET